MSIAVVAGNAAADPEIGLLAVLAGVPAGSPWCARSRSRLPGQAPPVPAPARSSDRRLRGQGRRG